MNKIVIVLFSLLIVALAEPPSSYGAPSLNFGYDDGGSDGGNHVDGELLARVAQILQQSESSSSSRSFQPSNSYGPPPSDSYGPPQIRTFEPPSNSYGPPPSDSYGPPQIRDSYGPPTRSVRISLGQPERAQRVAEFDLTSQFRGGYSGGYSSSSGGYN